MGRSRASHSNGRGKPGVINPGSGSQQTTSSINDRSDWNMNIHHLELFYYVARHGGITEAVRNIPYGIQQPAVSGQVGQLEEYLGVVLFQRRPFSLTPAGQKLY